MTVTTVRLVTANIASGRDQRTGRVDLDRWAVDAAGLDADVLALQEVDHRQPRSGGVEQVAQVERALVAAGGRWTSRFAAAVLGTPGDGRSFTPAAGPPGDHPAYGIAVLSRLPVPTWSETRMGPARARLPVPLPPGAGRRLLWVPDEPRVALAAVLPEPGLSVVCTHLSFSPVRAAAQLREVVRWAADLPRPVVLVGDLNLPGRWPTRVGGWPGLVHARTFPAARPVAQLDHVLLDDPEGRVGVVATSTPVLGGSDHRAVCLELTVRRSG